MIARGWRSAGGRADIAELMDLYTGMTSVHEALQWDRNLRLDRTRPRDWSWSVRAIEGVPLPAHPWEQMIAELGRQPVV